MQTIHSKTIVIICFAFLSWHTIQCFIKYFRNPKVTNISLDYTAKHPFPAITVCPNRSNQELTNKIKERLARCKIE